MYDYSIETHEKNHIYKAGRYPNKRSLPPFERRIKDSNLRYDDPRIRIPGFFSRP